MSLGITPTGPSYATVGPSPRDAVAPVKRADAPAPVTTPTPAPDRVELSVELFPREMVEAIERAHERALELWEQGRELHFTPAKDGGRVIVEVRDLDGNVIRTIPNQEALEILSGAAL